MCPALAAARRTRALAPLVLSALLACTGDAPVDGALPDAGARIRTAGLDGAALIYTSKKLLDVRIDTQPDDWDRIRVEGRTINQIVTSCVDPAFAYTVVPAAVHIEGESLAEVGLRKKGFLGSLSVERPALKLELDAFVADQSFHGVKDLTLNNNLSDGSLMHQCLAYGVFARAGLPASRCALARVSVNGRTLGVYSVIEPIKKPLLRRYFREVDGNLYEGSAGADFREGSVARFEQKNQEDPDREDLARVARALALEDDAAMLAALEEVLDVEQFLRFWAVETLVGHWDGYTGDQNNFYVYHDPSSDKLVFLPWGLDGTFTKTHAFLPPGGRPPATYAVSRLPRRLYAYAPTRERYRATLRALLTSAWDEEALLAEIEQLRERVEVVPDAGALDALRAFVRTRRADLSAELDAPAVPWTFPERTPAVCRPELNSPFRARFSASWGSLDALTPSADNALDLTLDGERVRFSALLASAGPFAAARGRPSLRLVGLLGDGSLVAVQFLLGALPDGPAEVALHGTETIGVALRGSPTTLTPVGYIGEGVLRFEQLSLAAGGAIVGSIEAKLVRIGSGQALPIDAL